MVKTNKTQKTKKIGSAVTVLSHLLKLKVLGFFHLLFVIKSSLHVVHILLFDACILLPLLLLSCFRSTGVYDLDLVYWFPTYNLMKHDDVLSSF